MNNRRVWSALALIGLAGLLASVAPTAADEATGPRVFETPEAVAKAVVEAVKANDDKAIAALLGPEAADLMQSASDPAVAKDRAEFVKRAEAALRIDDNEDGSKSIVVGRNAWPLPIPIVKTDAGWRLDAAAGREEVLARRVGRNELHAIDLCRAYARAQIAYASKDRDGDEVREYAMRVNSRPGQKDGLYWESGPDEEASPFGPLVAAAKQYSPDRQIGDPVGGYVWQILTRQGCSAPGGMHSYIINGNMIAGFALVGYPAKYRNTGVMTFLISHHGKILQRDLGSNTKGRVQAMIGYDPNELWSEVEGD